MRSVVLCLLLVACGNTSDKPSEGSAAAAGPPHGEAALKKMGELRDVACRCKDKSCVDRVNAAVTKWSADDQKTNGPLNYTPEQAERMGQIASEMGNCIQAVISPGHAEP